MHVQQQTLQRRCTETFQAGLKNHGGGNPTKDLHLMVYTTSYLKNAKLVFWMIMYCLTVRLQIMSLSNVSKSSWQNLNVPKITYCGV